MSKEAARAFLEKLKTDQDFAAKIEECQDSKERMDLAKSSGFTFTPEEMKQVQEELSDEELAQLAGGRLASRESCFCRKELL